MSYFICLAILLFLCFICHFSSSAQEELHKRNDEKRAREYFFSLNKNLNEDQLKAIVGSIHFPLDRRYKKTIEEIIKKAS